MTKEEFNKKFEDLISEGYLEKYIREKKRFSVKMRRD